MREAASFSPVYRRERDPERRDLAKISVHGGDFSQRGWRGLISILQVPHQPQNPHQPQDSVSSSTWHLRPILPQFWKPLWPNLPSKIVYCPLPRSLPPGTTSLVSPIRTSGLLEVGPVLHPQPDRPGAGRGRIPRRTGSSLPAPSSLGSPSHCLASVSLDIPTMPHCQPVPPSPRP